VIEVAIAAGAAAGLASIPHCAGMCGPVAAYAAGGGTGPKASVGYHAGRLASYAALGLVVGAAGEMVGDALPARWASALLSWSLAAALGLAAWRLWRMGDGRPARPVQLRTRGPRRRSLSERLLALLPKSPVALGLMTALLPCGALYSALLIAAGSGSAWAGGASMLAFGGVSAIGLAVVGAVAAKVRGLIARGTEAPLLSRVLATTLLVGALILAVRPLSTLGAEPTAPSCHDGGATASAASAASAATPPPRPVAPTP
jgi:hypothetical protein